MGLIKWGTRMYEDNRLGKIVKRKQGDIRYEVVDVGYDDTYLRHYNFSREFVKLKRLDGGSKTRPIGSTTSVVESDFCYNFEEVEHETV